MKNARNSIKAVLTVLVGLGVIFGVYFSNVNRVLILDDICDITSKACESEIFANPLRIYFEQPPVPEEELTIRFEFTESLIIESAWVEGVNMYMGKSPVVFENSADSEAGIVFLGACNLAQMQWLLHVQVKDAKSSEASTLKYTFSTVQTQ